MYAQGSGVTLHICLATIESNTPKLLEISLNTIAKYSQRIYIISHHIIQNKTKTWQKKL